MKNIIFWVCAMMSFMLIIIALITDSISIILMGLVICIIGTVIDNWNK